MKKLLSTIAVFTVCYAASAQDTVKVATGLPNQDAEISYNTGIENIGKKNYDGAIEMFNKAISLNPTFDKAYYNRGVAYYEKHSYNEAISDFNKTI